MRMTSAVSSEDISNGHPDCVDTADVEDAFDGVERLVHSLVAKVAGKNFE